MSSDTLNPENIGNILAQSTEAFQRLFHYLSTDPGARALLENIFKALIAKLAAKKALSSVSPAQLSALPPSPIIVNPTSMEVNHRQFSKVKIVAILMGAIFAILGASEYTEVGKKMLKPYLDALPMQNLVQYLRTIMQAVVNHINTGPVKHFFQKKKTSSGKKSKSKKSLTDNQREVKDNAALAKTQLNDGGIS